jgi:S-layer protein
MASSSTYSTIVQELYVTYFGRPADYNGLQNFEAALAAAGAPTDLPGLLSAYSTNAAIKSLVDSFGASPESIMLYGQVTTASSSATAFVTAVFENLLNRAPAASGLSFWVSAITSGSVSLGNAALAIAAGALSNNTAQGLIDGATVSNKIAAASAFTTDVAGADGVAAYSGPAAAILARGFLSGITSATSSQAAQTSAQQTATALAAAVTDHVFALTTGTDTLNGASGSNAFNAILDNAAGIAAGNPAATLNDGDSITGGTKANVLNINDFGLGATLALPAATFANITALNLNSAESIGTQDFSTWSGLKTVNVGLSHGTDNVTVAATTALSLSDNGASGSITTNGGASVSIVTDASHGVTVNGGSGTGTVAVNGGSSITIQDANFSSAAANTITGVTLSNPHGAAGILSNGLTSLAVNGDAGQSVTTSATVSLTPALTLALNGDTNAAFNLTSCLGLNVTTSGLASSGLSLVAAAAGALDFNDSVALSLSTLTAGSVIAVTIAGAGDFSANLSNISSRANIDATGAAGVTTVSLSGTQSFTGGTGQDNVTANSLAQTVIAGTSGSNIINCNNIAFNKNINLGVFANFATWETSGSTSGQLDMSSAGHYKNLVVNGAGGDLIFSNLAPDTPLSVTGSDSHAVTLQFLTPEVQASGTQQVLNLGTTNTTGVSLGNLSITGYNGAGAPVLNLNSNATAGQANQIGTLVDGTLSTLEISGTATLNISGTIATSAASFSYIDTVSGSSALGGLSDNALANLSIQSYNLTMGSISSSAPTLNIAGNGAGAISIGTIVDAQLTTAQISETSTSTTTTNTISVGASQLPNLQSLTLNGNVAIKVGGVTYGGGVTLSGTADDSPVSFTSIGATVTGSVDSVTLRNGNDQVTLGQGAIGSTQNITLGSGTDSITSASNGTVNITTGTASSGSDIINLTGNDAIVTINAGSSNQISLTGLSDVVHIAVGDGVNAVVLGDSASGNVTFAAHASADGVTIGQVGGISDGSQIVSITGLANNGADTITFSDSLGAASSFVQITAANVTASGGMTSSLSSWLAAALGKGGVVPQIAHGIEWFQFGGNTYIIELSGTADTGKFSVSDGAVELTGTGYTFAHSTFSGGVLHLFG